MSKPEFVAEAERLMRIDEKVLRYMLINVSKEVLDVEARRTEILTPPKTKKSEGSDSRA